MGSRKRIHPKYKRTRAVKDLELLREALRKGDMEVANGVGLSTFRSRSLADEISDGSGFFECGEVTSRLKLLEGKQEMTTPSIEVQLAPTSLEGRKKLSETVITRFKGYFGKERGG